MVMEEFDAEYNEETERGLKHGFYDPKKPLPEFQIGFVKFVVAPLYKTVNKIKGVNLNLPCQHIEKNLQGWRKRIVQRDITQAVLKA